MKTVIIFLFGLFLSIDPTYSQPQDELSSSIAKTNDKASLLDKQINKMVVYPLSHDTRNVGVVEIEFYINGKGKVFVSSLQSSDPNLAEYVSEKIKQIQLPMDDSSIGTMHKFRFVFKGEDQRI
jgi:hypothetical protein